MQQYIIGALLGFGAGSLLTSIRWSLDVRAREKTERQGCCAALVMPTHNCRKFKEVRR